MQVTFRQVFPWAILPRKVKVDPEPKREEARLMEENFRWVRTSRAAELCRPWRLAQEVGWVIDSPVSVTMDALHDVQVDCPPEALRQVTNLANATENWLVERGERIHCTRTAGWLALYDFRHEDRYTRMFYVNGQGTVEWVMGWDVTIPPSYFLMLLPYEPIPNLEVISGVLDAKSLLKPLGRRIGFSLAVRPTGPVALRRGQPVARLILLHPDTFTVKANVESDASLALSSPGEEEPPSSTEMAGDDSAHEPEA
jgi:hypothetical protein